MSAPPIVTAICGHAVQDRFGGLLLLAEMRQRVA
jgi:hypothetical protein